MNASDIISTHGLEFTFSPVMENPFFTQESSDLVHYYCNLHNEAISFDFYISMGIDYSEALTGDFCLTRVLEDIGTFRSCSGYPEFCRLIGVEEDDDKSRIGFDEIKRLSDNLDFLLTQEIELTESPTI